MPGFLLRNPKLPPLGCPALMQRTLVVIPARMQSTRLPNKPLADIHGVPMIVHVWRRAMAAETGRVVVATDAQEIMAAITAAGGEAVMTRADHQHEHDPGRLRPSYRSGTAAESQRRRWPGCLQTLPAVPHA